MSSAAIRPATGDDRAAISALYPLAFPDEDLLSLLGDMWSAKARPMMLIAEHDDQIVGHIAFSPCSVEGSDAAVLLLGPLAVHPEHQRKGIGSMLIHQGLSLPGDTSAVCLLGDPAYYSRHGFNAETGIAPPYPLPQEWLGAWQSVHLDTAQNLTGTLSVPAYWRDPALWGP